MQVFDPKVNGVFNSRRTPSQLERQNCSVICSSHDNKHLYYFSFFKRGLLCFFKGGGSGLHKLTCYSYSSCTSTNELGSRVNILHLGTCLKASAGKR